MKKKFHMISSVICIAMLCIASCFAFAGCKDAPVQLQNELGALLEGGGFEKGAALITDLIEATGEKGQEIVSLLEEQDYDKDGEVSIFDIFVSKDGSEVQPNGKVKVTLPAPFESESGYVTFHVRDDNSVETLETTYAEGKISFETDSFSYFVVASAKNSTEAKKYTFTAMLEGEGGGTIYCMSFPYSNKYETTVKEGTEITLNVEANGGFAFTGWYLVSERSDSFVSADAEYTFTVNSDMTVYARIAQTFCFDVMVFAGGGRLEVGGRDVGQNFMGDYVSGDTVTVKAIGDENHEFEGWYTNEATPALISSDSEYTFTVEGNTQVLARFQEKITSLSLDATGAGFSDGQATYSIGDANRPVPENVLVSGVTISNRIALEKDTDYTIDLGGLDLTRKGTYTVTYTYKKDPQIQATLTVIVEGTKYPLTVGQQGAGGYIEIVGTLFTAGENTPYTADLTAIRYFNTYYPIVGVTTNPSILSREGGDVTALLRAIRTEIGPDKELHVQVLETEAPRMIEEAKAIVAFLGKNTYVKIPATDQGLLATRELHAQGYGVTVTAVLSAAQAMLASEVGAVYVAPYVSRLENICDSGVGAVSDIMQIFRASGTATQVLAASFKTAREVLDTAITGCHAATVAPDVMKKLLAHTTTDTSIAAFAADWKNAFGAVSFLDLLGNP